MKWTNRLKPTAKPTCDLGAGVHQRGARARMSQYLGWPSPPPASPPPPPRRPDGYPDPIELDMSDSALTAAIILFVIFGCGCIMCSVYATYTCLDTRMRTSAGKASKERIRIGGLGSVRV
eukprot:7379168-Prymnesium_polylepis.2